MIDRYDLLSTREGFNIALRHFQLVNEYAQSIADGYNLSDMLNEDLQSGTLHNNQIIPIVNALLHDKFQYHNVQLNFEKTVESADKIHNTLSKWNALNMVLIYYDPVSGAVPVNLAEKSAIEKALPFVINEYALLYVGGDIKKDALLAKAAGDVAKVLNSKNVTPKKEYLRGVRKTYAPPAPPSPAVQSSRDTEASEGDSPPPAPDADSSTAGYRITPKYSVLVTNELFHNGNVEAWKKIIESYNHKFPSNEVLIWYDSERIRDINTLFKWGKVKHGTPIIFSVGGTDIGGVSKLQRYLFEGASSRYEAFLQGAHGQVLGLF